MTARLKRRHNREVSILCGKQLGGGVGASTARDAWPLLYICHDLTYGMSIYIWCNSPRDPDSAAGRRNAGE